MHDLTFSEDEAVAICNLLKRTIAVSDPSDTRVEVYRSILKRFRGLFESRGHLYLLDGEGAA